MESIEGLKKGVIPKLFGDPTRIGEYGLIGDSKEGMYFRKPTKAKV